MELTGVAAHVFDAGLVEREVRGLLHHHRRLAAPTADKKGRRGEGHVQEMANAGPSLTHNTWGSAMRVVVGTRALPTSMGCRQKHHRNGCAELG